MKKYIRYEIQKRKFSSNALLGIYIENGKKLREVILVPMSMKKEMGDQLTIRLLNFLTEQLNNMDE